MELHKNKIYELKWTFRRVRQTPTISYFRMCEPHVTCNSIILTCCTRQLTRRMVPKEQLTLFSYVNILAIGMQNYSCPVLLCITYRMNEVI